ncbi:MAG: hypothetical protein IT537_25285 [Hyphomicrobiales bacterium]|nr:hypothetical protein [Hyphomicrobiales bacterium]
MAARTTKVGHDPKTRDKIRTTQLLKRLHAYALSENDPQNGKPVQLSSTQVKAMEILLRKSLPDLQSIQGNMDLHHHRHEEALDDLE